MKKSLPYLLKKEKAAAKFTLAVIMLPYRRLIPSTVHATVGRGEICKLRLHKKVQLKGISIVLMPEYYEKQ